MFVSLYGDSGYFPLMLLGEQYHGSKYLNHKYVICNIIQSHSYQLIVETQH